MAFNFLVALIFFTFALATVTAMITTNTTLYSILNSQETPIYNTNFPTPLYIIDISIPEDNYSENRYKLLPEGLSFVPSTATDYITIWPPKNMTTLSNEDPLTWTDLWMLIWKFPKLVGKHWVYLFNPYQLKMALEMILEILGDDDDGVVRREDVDLIYRRMELEHQEHGRQNDEEGDDERALRIARALEELRRIDERRRQEEEVEVQRDASQDEERRREDEE